MRVMSAKSGPVISAVRVLGRRAYIWKVLVGYGVWVCKIFGEKKTAFWVETFSIYKKWDSILFRRVFRTNEWDLRKEYGEPNFGENYFQLFQLL